LLKPADARRHMLTDEELELLTQAGKITAQAREYGRELLVKGASVLDVTKKVEAKIRELGGEPAFPAQISNNDTAAHDCATFEDPRALCSGDLVKLDLGAHCEGFLGDTAVTVNLGEHATLVKAAEEALKAALELVKPGAPVAVIGATIEQTIKDAGYIPVRNLSGHGLEQWGVHMPPTIPNFDTGDSTVLEEGMMIAIEPFATDGAGLIGEKGQAEVFDLLMHKGVRTGFVRDILSYIETYNDMPFCRRWLAQEFGIAKTNFALQELTRLGMLNSYEPLVERNNGLVAQAEHSVYVLDTPIILTK